MKRAMLSFTFFALVIALVSSCSRPEHPLAAAELLDLGEKYLLEMDYEQAVVCFTKLIEVEPMNPRGYTGLSEVYICLGRSEDAIEVLRQGLERTNDSTIRQKLDEALHAADETQLTTENQQDASASAIELDVQLSTEQLDRLKSLETAILNMDYEVAYAIMTTSGLRLLFAEISDGENMAYKADENSLWKIRCLTARNSPDRGFEESYSNCSIGVHLTDGRVYWFDCFTTPDGYGSNFRVYDANGETTLLIIYDGRTATQHNGEPETEQTIESTSEPAPTQTLPTPSESSGTIRGNLTLRASDGQLVLDKSDMTKAYADGAAVVVELTERGSGIFETETERVSLLENNWIGIYLEDTLLSAPTVPSKITGNSFIITVQTESEAERLSQLINFGQ